MFSIIAVNLLFLLLPGFIGRKIIDYFSYSEKNRAFNYFLVDSFIIGVFSYSVVFVYKKIFSYPIFYLTTSIRNDKFSINSEEIFWSIIISLFFSLLYCYLKERDFFYNISSKIKLSNKSSNPSVFSIIFGFKYDDELKDKWIHLRPLNDNRTYVGYIKEWSVTNDSDFLELLLKEVTVYPIDKDSKKYDIYSLYLKIPYKDVIIEFLDNTDERREN
nr:MAG TPA: hypothetical protein [Caudoviricetes sp.]